jgi:hypothetical protein
MIQATGYAAHHPFSNLKGLTRAKPRAKQIYIDELFCGDGLRVNTGRRAWFHCKGCSSVMPPLAQGSSACGAATYPTRCLCMLRML